MLLSINFLSGPHLFIVIVMVGSLLTSLSKQLHFLISRQNWHSQFTSTFQLQYDMLIISMTPCLLCQPTPPKIEESQSDITQVHTESMLDQLTAILKLNGYRLLSEMCQLSAIVLTLHNQRGYSQNMNERLLLSRVSRSQVNKQHSGLP